MYRASTTEGAQVSIYTANQSEAQKWKLKKLEDGSCQIIAACSGDKMCLTNYQGSTASYTYDDNGIRTSKTVGNTKTTYYLNGSSIFIFRNRIKSKR